MPSWSRALGVSAVPAAAILLAACGGGGGGTGPDPVAPTHTVTVTLFYDENNDGVAQPTEVGRVPGVEVNVGGRTAITEKLTGRATVTGVREGSQPLALNNATLPAYFVSTANLPAVNVAAGAQVMVPLTLPIDPNRPFLYMAFGDSITIGEGSTRHEGGYRSVLRDMLRAHFGGAAEVEEQGQSGSKSDVGAERIGGSLNRVRPAYTLIMYGTNDYVRAPCQNEFPCFTIDALRDMVGAARSVRSLPILATIPPVQPESNAPGRNGWVGRMNELIKPMAAEQRVPVADVYGAFMREQSLSALFTDRLHPNDRGYEIIAAQFFNAITRPLGAVSTTSGPRRLQLLLAPPSAPARPRG
jgi:lysophospholipase L1-like esterase